MDFVGRSAIVTGGAGGLGSATVGRLVELGMRVTVFDRDGNRAGELANEFGEVARAIAGSVTNDGDVAASIEAARSLGRLSVLVNVAGGGIGGGPTVRGPGEPHDMETFVKTTEMNAIGTFNVTRLVAAVMSENDPDDNGQRGVVVNTASIAGRVCYEITVA